MRYVLRKPVVALALFFGCFALQASSPAHGQNVPPALQQELQRRGLTLEEALEQAERYGIDLTDPQEAARWARQLGIPEAQIQEWLRFLQTSGAQGTGAASMQPDTGRASTSDRYAPTLAGPAELSASSLILPRPNAFTSGRQRAGEPRMRWRSQTTRERPANDFRTTLNYGAAADSLNGFVADSVTARVPLYDDESGLMNVTMWLVNPLEADTVEAQGVRRILGSRYDGTWQGTFYVPFDVPSGRWHLLVSAVDEALNDNIIDTEAALLIAHEGEDLALLDSLALDTLEAQDSLRHFGYDLFARQTPDAFRPSQAGPVDGNYIVGPGDQLRLTVWGGAEFQYELTVDPEGRVFIPNVGQFTVAGEPLDDLTGQLRQGLSRSYEGLVSDPPTIFMDLAVTRQRPIQVYVMGEVEQPGSYRLPSGSTVFSALYAVGGPQTSGSLRNVQIVRGNQIVATVDLYDYLLNGFSSGDVRLQTGDRVFIPPRGNTVAAQGAVKRPALYELKDEERFTHLLAFSGGLEPEAYAKRFQVERIVPIGEREDPAVAREVLDFNLKDVLAGRRAVGLADGDEVTIFSIMEASRIASQRHIQAVSVGGAVYKPGRYELSGSVQTVRDLLREADGLTGDAFTQKAELIRLQDNLDREILSISLEKALADVPTHNLVLRPQDSLYVSSTQAMRLDRTVRVTGQVLSPGEYPYLENMTVSDLLFKGGGLNDPEFLKDVFLRRADLFRQSPDGSEREIVPFHLGDVLQGGEFGSTKLLPEDEVRVYPVEVEELRERFVTISGAVKDPGRYRLFDNMTIEDLVLQAGGFTEEALRASAEVTRPSGAGAETGRATSRQVPLAALDTDPNVRFAARAPLEARAAPGSFTLQHRDRVYVRPDPSFHEQRVVTVRGEVSFPGEYTILHENETLRSVIRRAGGVLETGYPRGGRLLRGGEQVIIEMDEALRGRGRADVALQDGDEVIIPPQPNTVAIRGNVANEGLVKYVPGQRVSYYLERAGGTRENTEAIYLTQPTGATFRVKPGWFRRTPTVGDGAQILVAEKPPEEPGERTFDVGRTLTETVTILSSTLTVILLGREAFR